VRQEKFDKLSDEVKEFVANLRYSTVHSIFFSDIIQAFPDVKKKHLKKIWEEMQ